ncbi:NACHT domain-containing protein [Methylovulum miyakonense]|uniref:NACHT domain-containing protein n=1 Tax=Methylovulum miyakonense TaxID=645578 RepID=UPI00036566B3|nr:hypothetical protein [Methylovulum miyakonense]
MYHVPRTCTEKKMDDGEESLPSPITNFRERAAYVLLGEPGAGKSSLFIEEAQNTDNGFYISARDFIDLDRNEWRDKTLFIDGLDEARAGKDDARTPLGAIRSKLSQLGCQYFRISCREADWLGSPDANDLARISPNQAITILHLNPLSSDDIEQIISNDQRVPDTNGFIEKAEQFGLSGLLNNPQTLDMLINAVKGGHGWPISKQEVYELACKQLASEFNDDHSVTQTATTPQLMEAAGFLCAVQLIANLSGFTEGQAGEGRISLRDLTIPNALPIQAALKTRLFNKTGNNEFSYVHRSVAEYLAAQFIAGKIKQGLLINRVLALTSGFDGGIVAALRGLMAWLSVHSEQARERLIEIDPVGVIVNGDALLFPRSAKSQLFQALIKEAKSTSFPNRDWHTTAFSAITTRDMANELSAVLNNTSRSNGEQFLLYCLLNGLFCSEPIATIKASLLTIIRDSSYWEGVRGNALDAFLHQYPEDLDSLLLLADDIRQGKIEDTENGLLENLLDKLFPTKITAFNIFQYLLPPKNNFVIAYRNFWRNLLPMRLTDTDLAVVLDQLFELKTDSLGPMGHKKIVGIIDTVGQLLIRGLQIHGLTISSERLYRWLSIDINEYNHYTLPLEQRQQINSWLDSHPDRYLAIIGEGLKQIKTFENIFGEIRKIFSRLHDTTPPKTIAQWWLNQALSETDFKLSCAYFEQAFITLYDQQNDTGLSLDYFVNWLEDHPEYLETYQHLTYYNIPDWRYEHINSEKIWAAERDEELNKKLSYLHEHQAQIADGSAPPHIFNQLAIAFNHLVQTNGKSREERLAEYLNNDEILINAAKTGLRKILQRTDLPTPLEIYTSAVKSKYHYIRLPFLVCMDTLYQENPAMLESLSDELLSKAVAFCFAEGTSHEAWFKSLYQSKPELVSRLFIDYVRALLAAKSQFIHGLHNLAYDPDLKKTAKLTVMPLLNKYPVRGYKNHVTHLKYLLEGAIADVDKIELLTMVEKKLTCKGMDLAQRIYWLATGLVIEPKVYEAQVKQTVTGKSQRINRLSSFLIQISRSDYDRYDFPASTKGMLIEVLAPRCNPLWPRSGTVTPATEEKDYVQFLLNGLAYNPSEESAAILADLLSQPKLSAWHTQIQSAQQTQQLSRREALFKHPNAAQVINTLSNLKPANVADLAALTVDCLEQLAAEIHGSSNDSYKQFWNVDSNGKPTNYRVENICRDYLYGKLKASLAKYDIQVDLEVHHAKAKRADLELSFIRDGKTLKFPVEIKCDYNKDLWKTIHEQLIPFYTIAPETEGRGLFLVIWFKLPTHPQGLPPPTSTEQLAAMLKNTMTPQEQKLIDVFVLDVSKKH